MNSLQTKILNMNLRFIQLLLLKLNIHFPEELFWYQMDLEKGTEAYIDHIVHLDYT